MGTCTDCGADVTHAKTQDGTNIPLEKYTEPAGTAHRYRIVKLGPPLVVEMVSTESAIDAYPDHRDDCPGHGNGLR